MKQFLSAILIMSLLLGLAACSDWSRDEFLSVTPHKEQPVSSDPTEEEVPLTVTNRSELRGAVLSFIRDWTERGTFLVSGYSGLYAKQKFAFSKLADATGTIPEEESIHRT